MGVLKVGVLNVRSKLLAPQGEAGSRRFAPDCVVCQDGVYDKYVSPFLPVSMWLFSQ